MKKCFLLTVFVLSFFHLFSQRSEIGLFGGTSYYIGDLNPSTQFLMSKPAFGGLYRYNINPRFTFKLDFFYGSVEGDDALANFNKNRNLYFKSNIFEVSPQLELNFLPYVTGKKKMKFSPYLFAGISIFKFAPKSYYDGKWYNLQPLGTEGQGTSMYPERKPYSQTSFAFPFGIGIKYSLSEKICIGAEWGMRKTFTDYLDDVSTTYADPIILAAENGAMSPILADRSILAIGDNPNKTGLQRGNSTTNDWYSFAGVFITYRLKTKKDKGCSAYPKHSKYKDYYLD